METPCLFLAVYW